jgi:1-acyl-sn-glycerol-3-phosphate acyltransferase
VANRGDHLARSSEQDLLWRVADPLVRAVFTLGFRIRSYGTRHIPRTGGALLTPNHISVLDPVVLALPISARGRTVRFLAGAEFFEKGFAGWGLRTLQQIPVRRGAADWGALDELAAVIERGSLAGIFPEGHLGPGPLQRGRRGAARIALAAHVPVIPVGIWGTQARWPMGGFNFGLPARPRVAVVFGAPIEASGDPRSREDVGELTQRIMAEIGGLADQARQDVLAPRR